MCCISSKRSILWAHTLTYSIYFCINAFVIEMQILKWHMSIKIPDSFIKSLCFYCNSGFLLEICFSDSRKYILCVYFRIIEKSWIETEKKFCIGKRNLSKKQNFMKNIFYLEKKLDKKKFSLIFKKKKTLKIFYQKKNKNYHKCYWLKIFHKKILQKNISFKKFLKFRTKRVLKNSRKNWLAKL